MSVSEIFGHGLSLNKGEAAQQMVGGGGIPPRGK